MIYLDSCVLIGLMESLSSKAAEIVGVLKQQQWQHCSIAISELVRMECLVGCRRAKYKTMEADYESYFADPSVHFLPIDRDVWNRAITLRGKHTALRIPDALHLAIAITHHCHAFWSFDKRLLAIADDYLTTCHPGISKKE